MFDIRIPVLIIGLPIFLFGVMYLMSPRKTKNFLMDVLPGWKKKYVVVHLRYPQTNISERHHVIPSEDTLTPLKGLLYDLNPAYAIFVEGNRRHFLVDYNNSIPQRLEQKDLIFQATTIKKAFTNSVLEFFFSKSQDLKVILMIIAIAIAILLAAYNMYMLASVKAAITQIPIKV